MTYPNQPVPPQPMGSTNTVFITEIRYDPSFMRTLEGILKTTIMLLSLIGFICIQSSAFWSNGRGVFFSIVANLGFWSAGVLTLLYLFHFVEKYHNVKWLKIELGINVALVFLFLIASTIVVAFGSAAYSAAGLFGYLAMVTCGGEALVRARSLRDGHLAQGRRVTAKAAPPLVLPPPDLP